jgi:hypothetical protein
MLTRITVIPGSDRDKALDALTNKPDPKLIVVRTGPDRFVIRCDRPATLFAAVPMLQLDKST